MATRFLAGTALVIAGFLAFPTLLAVIWTIGRPPDVPGGFEVLGVRLDTWWPAFALAIGAMLVVSFWLVLRPTRD